MVRSYPTNAAVLLLADNLLKLLHDSICPIGHVNKRPEEQEKTSSFLSHLMGRGGGLSGCPSSAGRAVSQRPNLSSPPSLSADSPFFSLTAWTLPVLRSWVLVDLRQQPFSDSGGPVSILHSVWAPQARLCSENAFHAH